MTAPNERPMPDDLADEPNWSWCDLCQSAITDGSDLHGYATVTCGCGTFRVRRHHAPPGPPAKPERSPDVYRSIAKTLTREQCPDCAFQAADDHGIRTHRALKHGVRSDPRERKRRYKQELKARRARG